MKPRTKPCTKPCTKPHRRSISSMLRALEDGSISSVELTQEYLDAIERLDPQLNAFITVDTQGALDAASASDDARAAGKHTPLLGIPFAAKDAFLTQGLRTTCASRMLENFIAPYESTPTAKLKEAGAILLGKTNMDEFAMGSTNEHSAFGPCHNPWDPTRSPGGSSGGSAAAVAAGLCPAALGSDTGGSVRQPASFCGVVGVKPTYGRVSRYGLVAFASSLDQAGVLAPNIEDAARILQVISGHDPLDPTSIDAPAPNLLEAIRLGLESLEGRKPHGLLDGLTIGLPREYFPKELDPETQRACLEALKTLENAGVKLREINLPHTHHAIAAYYLICTAEASSNLARFDGIHYGHRAAADPQNPHNLQNPQSLQQLYTQSRSEGFGDEVKRRIMLGTYVLSEGYRDAFYDRARKVRTLIQRDFAQAFTLCDLIATPTAPHTAIPLDALLSDPLQMYLSDAFTTGANLAGLPALSLPISLASDTLPMGLQLMAPPLAETRLFSLAAALEARQAPLPRPNIYA